MAGKDLVPHDKNFLICIEIHPSVWTSGRYRREGIRLKKSRLMWPDYFFVFGGDLPHRKGYYRYIDSFGYYVLEVTLHPKQGLVPKKEK